MKLFLVLLVFVALSFFDRDFFFISFIHKLFLHRFVMTVPQQNEVEKDANYHEFNFAIARLKEKEAVRIETLSEGPLLRVL